MGDCLAVVNLVEASRMDYNFDVTELAINPTLLCFFFFFGFWFLFFFFGFLRGRLPFVFSRVLGDQRFWELPRVVEGGGFFFLTLVGWVFGRGCLEFLGKWSETRNSTRKWPQPAKEFAPFSTWLFPSGFCGPQMAFMLEQILARYLVLVLCNFYCHFSVFHVFLSIKYCKRAGFLKSCKRKEEREGQKGEKKRINGRSLSFHVS